MQVTVAVNNLSYNQLVETIICDRSSADSLALSRALVAEQWLDESQAQLTYHGLCELNSTIKGIGAHFIIILKYELNSKIKGFRAHFIIILKYELNSTL